MKNQFWFNRKVFTYVDMRPNQTRVNERRVELPIAFNFIEELDDNVIEIGNVTRHYRDYKHDVVDLNEKVKWEVWNEDVLTWTPKKEYAGAISISTVEHTNDPLLAVQRILTFAKRALITVPVGYNRVREIIDNIDMFFLKRTNDNNEWVEATYNVVKDYKYGFPFPFANAIGVIIK